MPAHTRLRYSLFIRSSVDWTMPIFTLFYARMLSMRDHRDGKDNDDAGATRRADAVQCAR